jgi:hypothetical protein
MGSGRCAEGTVLICPGVASRRGLPHGGSTRSHGGSTRRQGHPGRLARLRCGDWRAAAGGCHCASLMMKRSEAAAAVRPGPAAPFPADHPRHFPQFTCLGQLGWPVLPPLFVCGLRARPALAVLAWSGDGSPVWGCTTTSGDQVPPRTLFRNMFLTGTYMDAIRWVFRMGSGNPQHVRQLTDVGASVSLAPNRLGCSSDSGWASGSDGWAYGTWRLS